MNTAAAVENLMADWRKKGLSKPDFIVKLANACLGWPYIFGARGQYCTPSYRKQRSAAVGGAEGEVIAKKCQVCNGKSSCDGCKWYPKGKTRSYDCRGFTYWTFYQIGINIEGQGATSQYNTKANWTEQGEIKNMPETVCCVFMYKSSTKKMEHTGIYIGNGVVIHCSGEVKKGKITDKGWTHYAIPVGMSGAPVGKPTLKKGDAGQYVTLMQTKLIQRGYDVGKTGADGKFGANTESGLKAFQKDSGLPATGVCDDATWDALESGKTPLYTVTVQHVSKSVAEGIIKTYGGSMKAEGE